MTSTIYVVTVYQDGALSYGHSSAYVQEEYTRKRDAESAWRKFLLLWPGRWMACHLVTIWQGRTVSVIIDEVNAPA